MSKVWAADVPDPAPKHQGFSRTDAQGNRVPARARKLRIEEHSDGSASLHVFDDQGPLAVDEFNSAGEARDSAFHDFGVDPGDWQAA